MWYFCVRKASSTEKISNYRDFQLQPEAKVWRLFTR
jgi:hypothetical protein